jgi:uncharacterized protein (UPF0335 family)
MENKVENKVDLHLKRLIENIEKLEDEKKEISNQISGVYKEAKGSGFDAKIMRRLISLRKMDNDDLQEQEYLLETYKEALGMK